jgi:hypothetical protein
MDLHQIIVPWPITYPDKDNGQREMTASKQTNKQTKDISQTRRVLRSEGNNCKQTQTIESFPKVFDYGLFSSKSNNNQNKEFVNFFLHKLDLS